MFTSQLYTHMYKYKSNWIDVASLPSFLLSPLASLPHCSNDDDAIVQPRSTSSALHRSRSTSRPQLPRSAPLDSWFLFHVVVPDPLIPSLERWNTRRIDARAGTSVVVVMHVVERSLIRVRLLKLVIEMGFGWERISATSHVRAALGSACQIDEELGVRLMRRHLTSSNSLWCKLLICCCFVSQSLWYASSL